MFYYSNYVHCKWKKWYVVAIGYEVGLTSELDLFRKNEDVMQN